MIVASDSSLSTLFNFNGMVGRRKQKLKRKRGSPQESNEIRK
jgi:hypothetical protein